MPEQNDVIQLARISAEASQTIKQDGCTTQCNGASLSGPIMLPDRRPVSQSSLCSLVWTYLCLALSVLTFFGMHHACLVSGMSGFVCRAFKASVPRTCTTVSARISGQWQESIKLLRSLTSMLELEGLSNLTMSTSRRVGVMSMQSTV